MAAKSVTPSIRLQDGTYKCVGHPDCEGHERANDVITQCQCCAKIDESR
jgi:hypothetical protein